MDHEGADKAEKADETEGADETLHRGADCSTPEILQTDEPSSMKKVSSACRNDVGSGDPSNEGGSTKDGQEDAIPDETQSDDDSEQRKEPANVENWEGYSTGSSTSLSGSESDASWYAKRHVKKTESHMRRIPLEIRKKKRDEARRGQYRSILLVDDRLTRLERQIAKVLNLPKKRESESPPRPPIIRTIPEVKRMSWQSWSSPIFRVTRPTIELLVEKPILYPEQQALRGSRQPQKIPERPQFAERELQLGEYPERIRINSLYLLRYFSGLGGIDSPFNRLHESRVYRRPFSFLGSIRNDIVREYHLLDQMLNSGGLPKTDQNIDRLAPNEPAKTTKKTDRKPDEELRGDFEDMKCLLKVINLCLVPIPARIAAENSVRFSELWYLYDPGQLVFVKDPHVPQKFWRVTHVKSGNRYLSAGGVIEDDESTVTYEWSSKRDTFSPAQLTCYYLDFDGTRLKPVYKRFRIDRYDGNEPVKNLPIVPLEYASELCNKGEIINRGSQFLAYTKTCHCHYSGRTVVEGPTGTRLFQPTDNPLYPSRRLISEQVEGAVMVDIAKALQTNPDWVQNFDPLPPITQDGREWYRTSGYAYEQIEPDDIWDKQRSEDFENREDELGVSKRWAKCEVSSENELLILPDRVFAFVLQTRRWVCLPLGLNGDGEERLRPIFKNDSAWNELQLLGGDNADGHKRIIRALIDKHFAKDQSFDLVQDKGRGLIMLLHGAPGVGKTSTAECVAQYEAKPLLPITCGDLGLEPQTVEANLAKHFELAQDWDCILLLDEADVFLARRTLEDVKRNALVSVFLRILEYYDGILFLTTNRVGILDEAFKSRIHMALSYPWLDWDQTKAIWKSLMRKAKESQPRLVIDREEILEFAKEHLEEMRKSPHGIGPAGEAPGWNGRQIRNAFMSAIALAQFEAGDNLQVKLDQKHFKTVARASKSFDEYLYRVHGQQSDSKRAERGKLRFDTPLRQNHGEVAESPYQPQQSFYQTPQQPYQQAQTGYSRGYPDLAHPQSRARYSSPTRQPPQSELAMQDYPAQMPPRPQSSALPPMTLQERYTESAGYPPSFSSQGAGYGQYQQSSGMRPRQDPRGQAAAGSAPLHFAPGEFQDDPGLYRGA